MVTVERETKETKIKVELEPYGTGKSAISTGVGFFDHMLEALAKHGLLDLTVECRGDTHIDDHHTVEDVGIVLGQAFKQAVFPAEGIERYANRAAVLDEAAVEVLLDVSGRPYLHYEMELDGKVGTFDAELAEEFFRAFVTNAGLTAHIVLVRGRNKHHIIEAAFKAFAVALRSALAKHPRMTGVPSTKGVL